MAALLYSFYCSEKGTTDYIGHQKNTLNIKHVNSIKGNIIIVTLTTRQVVVYYNISHLPCLRSLWFSLQRGAGTIVAYI